MNYITLWEIWKGGNTFLDKAFNLEKSKEVRLLLRLLNYIIEKVGQITQTYPPHRFEMDLMPFEN